MSPLGRFGDATASRSGHRAFDNRHLHDRLRPADVRAYHRDRTTTMRSRRTRFSRAGGRSPPKLVAHTVPVEQQIQATSALRFSLGDNPIRACPLRDREGNGLDQIEQRVTSFSQRFSRPVTGSGNRSQKSPLVETFIHLLSARVNQTKPDHPRVAPFPRKRCGWQH